MSKAKELLGLLEVSGGDQVLGKTKSGKKIYMDNEHSGHDDFDSKDHTDASKLHRDLEKKAKDEVDRLDQARRVAHKAKDSDARTKASLELKAAQRAASHHGKQSSLHAKDAKD